MRSLLVGLGISAWLFGCTAKSDGQSSPSALGSGGSGSGHSGGGSAGTGASGGSAGTGASGGVAGGAGGARSPSEYSLGMLVIDVQEAFVSGSHTGDMPGIIARTKHGLELASAAKVPFFITFEDSTMGDHSLHAPLAPLLPGQAQEFVKTTFDATGLPAFTNALTQLGPSHVVVLGTETDVCVMQTVLGLRELGFTVLLESDAVFSSEPNASPAIRRMEQAGVHLVSEAEVAGYVAAPSTLPAPSAEMVRVVKPLHMGVVLNDLTDASLAVGSDPLKTQKLARLRELLLVSEWFELPVYATNPGGLPQSLAPYYQSQLRSPSQIPQDASVEQLVFAGTDAGLSAELSALGGSHALFVMEDALLAQGGAGAQQATLQPFIAQGLVPTTYKSFYYEMTTSVDLTQWPSQTWVQRFDEYFDITSAPEDLPPMPPS